jgi:hypothetical protein
MKLRRGEAACETMMSFDTSKEQLPAYLSDFSNDKV